jgi:hypothetical protein
MLHYDASDFISSQRSQRTILLVLKLKLDEDGAAKRLPEVLALSEPTTKGDHWLARAGWLCGPHKRA